MKKIEIEIDNLITILKLRNKNFETKCDVYAFNAIDMMITSEHSPVTIIKYLETKIKETHSLDYHKIDAYKRLLRFLYDIKKMRSNKFLDESLKASYMIDGVRVEATEKHKQKVCNYLDKKGIVKNTATMLLVLRRLVLGGDINSKYEGLSLASSSFLEDAVTSLSN